MLVRDLIAALEHCLVHFCRPHKSLRGDTPAMAAGLAEHLYGLGWIVDMIENRAPQPGPRGSYRPRVTV